MHRAIEIYRDLFSLIVVANLGQRIGCTPKIASDLAKPDRLLQVNQGDVA